MKKNIILFEIKVTYSCTKNVRNFLLNKKASAVFSKYKLFFLFKIHEKIGNNFLKREKDF